MRVTMFFLVLSIFLAACQREEFGNNGKGSSNNASLKDAIEPLSNAEDLSLMVNDIGDARVVLLGESSHGNADYYVWRAELTKKLIQEKGFTLVAFQSDWTSMDAANAYVAGADLTSSSTALQQLKWPAWVWQNQETASFLDWLRNYNLPQTKKISIHGLDLYSLWESMDKVIEYLEKNNPELADTSKYAYGCLQDFKPNEASYSHSTMNEKENCSEEATLVYDTLFSHTKDESITNERIDALQHARIVKNAERYYYNALRSNSASWNIRDRHMAETVEHLLAAHGPDSKIIVWGHNTHIGDGSASEMSNEGFVTLGQLLREKYTSERVYIVGFGAYSGSVTASNEWSAPGETMVIPEARTGSWEEILHRYKPSNKMVFLRSLRESDEFIKPLGHRSIGVVYNPAREESNYIPTIIPQSYDAFIFIDRVNPVRPLGPADLEREAVSRF